MKPAELQRKYDKIQVAMFQALFKLRLPEHGADMAFASAIADTGDHIFREAVTKRPHLIMRWIRQYSERKNTAKKRLAKQAEV